MTNFESLVPRGSDSKRFRRPSPPKKFPTSLLGCSPRVICEVKKAAPEASGLPLFSSFKKVTSSYKPTSSELSTNQSLKLLANSSQIRPSDYRKMRMHLIPPSRDTNLVCKETIGKVCISLPFFFFSLQKKIFKYLIQTQPGPGTYTLDSCFAIAMKVTNTRCDIFDKTRFVIRLVYLLHVVNN